MQYPAPTSDERELLLRFLHRQRLEVVATATDLTEEQARWAPEGGLLPIIGIINHLIMAEYRWIDGRYLHVECPPQTADEFRVAPDRSLADVTAAYRERERRTEEAVRRAPSLEVPCLGGPQPTHIQFGFDEPVDLRWVVLHLIEETAHHAGHADSTRELLDGKKIHT